MKSQKNMNRRMFLMGMGKTALAIPLLPSLLPREAQAQASQIAPRFIAMSSQNGGARANQWYPATLPTQNRTLLYPATAHPRAGFSYYNAPAHYIHSAPIVPSSAGISTLFDSKFSPYASKMTFLRGLDWRYSPDGNHVGGPVIGNIKHSNYNIHGFTDYFPTIDQVMAYANGFYPNNGVGYVRSLNICLNNKGEGMSWGFQNPTQRSGAVQLTPFSYDPLILFKQLFPGGPAPGSTTSTTPYIDAVLEKYKKVRDGRLIGRDDKLLLQAHIDLFADLEKNLLATIPAPTAAQCTAPAAPASQSPINQGLSDAVIRQSFSAMNSLITLAMSCQRTRVATFYISTVPGFEGLGGDAFDSSKWHWATHNMGSGVAADNTNANAFLLQIFKWISNNAVYDLISKMNSITEPNGKTLLDNSLLQYSTASMDGPHNHDNMPVLLFGSAGGKIKTGMYHDYQNRDVKNFQKTGLLYNQYLITAMQAMGLTANDYSMTNLKLLYGRYPTGAGGYGEYLPQPDSQYEPKNTAYYIGSTRDIAKPLPGVLA